MKNTLKKLLAVSMSAFILLALFTCVTAFADDAAGDKVTVTFNGEKMDFDVDPIVENDRTLVPFRAIFEALGCAVTYIDYGDGKPIVGAQRGNEYVALYINNTTMYVNGDEVTLDVAPKIVNDRTLVPLRAVSESLDCDVKWYDDTNTAAIFQKLGQYNITPSRLEKTVTYGDNVLMTITCVYPVIENSENNEFIDKINKKYRDMADNFSADIEKEYSSDAENMFENLENYTPMNFELTYNVNTNRKDIISITTADYRNSNGAHPYTLSSSVTYDMSDEKELSLYDVLDGTESEIDDAVCEGFTELLTENGIEMTDEQVNTVKNAAPIVNWYVKDGSIVLYYNQYDIAPYAFGVPTIEIPYDADTMKIDLSETELDALEFELDGNPTTGYSWEITDTDSDKLDIQSEYIPDETDKDINGAGGKYKFTVKGISPGNASFNLSYMRNFEKDKPALKDVSYKLYVSKDNKITVISNSLTENISD